MTPRRPNPRGAAAGRRPRQGFTLVELMIALTIGLVLSLAVALSMLQMGRQFRAVGSTSAAQVNAQVALSLIDEVGRMAGAGLYNGGQPLCLGFNAWNGTAVVSNGAPLLAARITDGGSAGAADTLVFTYSNAAGPLSGLPVLDAMASAADPIFVSEGAALAAGDVAIVGVPGSTTVPCTLFSVSGPPGPGAPCAGNATSCQQINRTPSTGFNAPGGSFAVEPLYAFATAGGAVGPAVVHRLGTTFRQEAFRVMCQTLVQYNAFLDAPTCTQSPLAFTNSNALVTDVVLMHAQYGVSATPASDIVTNWVDASGGTWAAPSAANSQRIKAIRIVLVSRSKEPASENVTAASCTNAGGIVNTGPCSFNDAEAPVIDLSGVAVPSGRTWRNYRYRVHQAVIPLRSVIWSS